MRNIIGQVARGKDFFPRKREIDRIEKAIKTGSHIQLAAPRRVGKTSILMHFIDEDMIGYEFVYVDTEAVYNESDFYKKIVQEVIKCKSISGSTKVVHALKERGNSFLKRLKGFDLQGNGVQLNNEIEGINYYDEFKNLILGIQVEKTIVVMIDEFPHTINNILGEKKEGKPNAIRFLQSNRTLRLDPEIYRKVQFIYTGSIGLNTTVENIGATDLINDISSVPVKPLLPIEAKDLAKQILEPLNITMTEDVQKYLFEKIKWLIPFYIKLMIKEIDDLIGDLDNKNEVSREDVDNAFKEILDYRNNNYFEHYHGRLKMYYSGKTLQCVIQILSYIANYEQVEKSKLYDIAVGYDRDKEFKNLIQTLEYDGYIYTEDTGLTFKFNSPILRMWWKKQICI